VSFRDRNGTARLRDRGWRFTFLGVALIDENRVGTRKKSKLGV
jgi:hypothetical protein